MDVKSEGGCWSFSGGCAQLSKVALSPTRQQRLRGSMQSLALPRHKCSAQLAVTFPMHAVASLFKNFLFGSIYRHTASDKVAITWCYRPMRPRNPTASTWGGCRKLLSGTPTGTLSSGRFGSTTGCQPKPWFNTELPIPRSFNLLKNLCAFRGPSWT